MKTPHKHAELIKAWADGEQIEYFNTTYRRWEPIFKGWSWDSELYVLIRIKPKPDFVYYGVFEMDGSAVMESCFTKINDHGDQIKLTFDGETGKLKSAEVLND